MEDDDDRVGPRPAAVPQQPADYREVEGGARPAHGVGGPGFPEERADEEHIAAVIEPYPQGLGVEEPVRVQLGDAGEEVDRTQLRAERPYRPYGHGPVQRMGAAPRVERRRAVQRHEDHQEAEQAYEVVVVEVGRLVEQFDVREEEEEGGDGEAVAVAERDAEGGEPEKREVGVHAPGGPRLHPPEAGVGEVVLRRDIELVDPASRGEADDGDDAERAERDAERRTRRATHRTRTGLGGAVEQARHHAGTTLTDPSLPGFRKRLRALTSTPGFPPSRE